MRERGLVLLLLWTAACTSAADAGPGAACTRSTQCAAGLACVEGRCSDDLDAIEDQSEVPMLMQEPAGGDGPADAGSGPAPDPDAGSDAAAASGS